MAFLAYNEEELIAKTVAEAVSSLSAVPGLDWRVLVVNDGSRDRTGEIAEELAKKDPRVSVVHHQGNKGYAVATETALRNTPGEVVMVVDGDGQHTMADAPRFLAAIDEGADVVFGWKKERHDPLPRLVLSKGLNTLSALDPRLPAPRHQRRLPRLPPRGRAQARDPPPDQFRGGRDLRALPDRGVEGLGGRRAPLPARGGAEHPPPVEDARHDQPRVIRYLFDLRERDPARRTR